VSRTIGYESGNQPTIPVAIAIGDPNEDAQFIDQDKPLPVKLRSETTLADSNYAIQASTTYSKFSDGFNMTGSTTFDPARWDTLRQTGITLLASNGAMVATVPATAGAELLVVGKVGATIPSNLMATLMASVRNNTTLVRIGYVAVDATTGVPIVHATVPTDFAHRANVLYNGTAATSVVLETISSSSAAKQVSIGSQVTSATAQEMSLEARAEDVTLATATPDSIAARAAGGRVSSQVPNPNLVYRPFIWIVNTSNSAAATWTFYRIVSMDIQELQAEVGGGRGNSAASQAIPVAGTVTVASGTVSIGNTLSLNRQVTWNELGTALPASQTITTTARALGSTTSGAPGQYSIQRVRLIVDQACTLYFEQSWDGTTWYTAALPATVTPSTLGVGQAFDFKTPVMMTNARVRVVNGATAQTITQLMTGGSEN